MFFDVKKLFSGEEECLAFDYEMDLSSTIINTVKPFTTPIRVQGQICSNAGAPQLHADVTFGFSIPCDRCTAQIDREYRYSFDHGLVPTLNEEDNDFYLVVEDGVLDLDELIRSDILLELPTKYLCSSDCKGLCPICGANQNQETCACNTRQIDPRLEILKQLIDE